MGYIFQQFNLVPYLSLVHNVLLPCRFSSRRRERAAPARRVRGAIAEAAYSMTGERVEAFDWDAGRSASERGPAPP